VWFSGCWGGGVGGMVLVVKMVVGGWKWEWWGGEAWLGGEE